MNPEIIKKYGESNHFGKWLGMELTILAPGSIEYKLHIRKDHMATPNAAHGGVIAALMDSVLGVTALSAVFLEGKVVSTVEYKINYFAPALLHDQLLATGKIEQKGKRLIVVSGEIICTNRDNTCLAKGLGTFNAYPADKAGY
ncbi:MAG: PaaI family thioesterase [Bacteroidetes bacterium]|nr:PaaI family thioesterase [Bacteroidota bacterium]